MTSPPTDMRPRALVAIALLAALPAGLAADVGDREKPIHYSADRGDLNYETKLGKLDGNVVLTQGTITVRADRLTFKQNADNSMQVSATGNPVSFRQRRDGSDEYYEGYAQRVEYDGAKDLLELFDRALLKRGPDEIRSNYISYNAKTELFQVNGGGKPAASPGNPEGRVKAVIQPKPKAPPTSPAPDKTGNVSLKPAAGIER